MGCFFIPLLTLEYLGVGLRKTLPPPLFFGFQKGLGVLRMPQFSREIFLEGWPPPFLKSVNFYPPNHPPGQSGGCVFIVFGIMKMIEDDWRWKQKTLIFSVGTRANQVQHACCGQPPTPRSPRARWTLGIGTTRHRTFARCTGGVRQRGVPNRSFA